MQSTNAKHPKGLWILFFTEMWERFGYYLMLGIFSLYMIDSLDNGGMGFNLQKKSDIYGTYLGLVYLTPFIGGLIADRILGYRRSIIIGGVLMGFGYLTMSMPGESVFYISLLLIIFGNGFFKPNISTLLGNLYNSDILKSKKDAAYNIFYAGINIGAFVCNFIASYMRINYGWGWAFAVAGIGMFIGVAIFIFGSKHVKEADVLKPTQKGDMPTGKILLSVIVPMFIFGLIGYFIPDNIFGSDTNDAFLIGCLPVIAFFIFLYVKANKNDKRPIGALLAVYGCLVVFWAVFHQNGDALTIWAENYTNRELPESISQPVNSIGLAQVLVNDSTDISYSKYLAYTQNLPSENHPQYGSNLKLASAELFQSINPFWVIVLTPVIVGIFALFRRFGKEPSTPSKIAIGLLITALSAIVMVMAVESVNVENEKASSFWLFASYGVITIGELCLSPMGLSLVSKLSPTRITALMMGGFFLSTSVGNKLSGILSSMWETYEDKSHFFMMNFALVLPAAILMFFLLKWLNKVMSEKGIK
ncbi:MAG: peptide MFS transporter [Marinilabiliaceae bacterium]|nr:peptide MFS transporter [Marinilabiliaceae bacterium]